MVKVSTKTFDSTAANVLDVSTIKDRLRWSLEHSRLSSQRALSQKAGLSDSHVNTALDPAKSIPTVAVLRKIAKATDVSLGWIVTGHGAPTPYEGDEPDDHVGEGLGAEPAGPSLSPIEAHASVPASTAEDFDRLFERAYVSGHQNPRAAAKVVELIQAGKLTIPADTDAVVWARKWFDVASSLWRRNRQARAEITPESLVEEFTRLELEREGKQSS